MFVGNVLGEVFLNLNTGDRKKVPGYRLRLEVADWNNDGKLDLLVGNCYRKDGKTRGNVYLFLRK